MFNKKPLWIYRADKAILLSENQQAIQTVVVIPTETEEKYRNYLANKARVQKQSNISLTQATNIPLIPEGNQTLYTHATNESEEDFLKNHVRTNLIIIDDNLTLEYCLEDNDNPDKETIVATLRQATTNQAILSFLLDLEQYFLNAGADSFVRKCLLSKEWLLQPIKPRITIIKKESNDCFTVRVVSDAYSIRKYKDNRDPHATDVTEAIIPNPEPTKLEEPILTFDTTFTITAIQNNEAKVACTENFTLGYHPNIPKVLPELLTADLIKHTTEDGTVLYDKKPPSLWQKTINYAKNNPIKTGATIIAAAVFPAITLFALIISIPIITIIKLQDWSDKDNKNIAPFDYTKPRELSKNEITDGSVADKLSTIKTNATTINENLQNKSIVTNSNAAATADQNNHEISNNISVHTKNKPKFSLKNLFFRKKTPRKLSNDPILNQSLLAIIQISHTFSYDGFLQVMTQLYNHAQQNVATLTEHFALLSKKDKINLINLFNSKKCSDIYHTLQQILAISEFNVDDERALKQKQTKAKQIIQMLDNVKNALFTLPEAKKVKPISVPKNKLQYKIDVQTYLLNLEEVATNNSAIALPYQNKCVA